MSRRRRVVSITIVAPVAPERLAALQRAIDALEVGPRSPMAQIAGLHVGRFTIIENLETVKQAPAPPPGPYLLFSADIDPPETAAIAAVATHCGEILRYCKDCPEPTDGRAFDRWLNDHRVRDGFTVMPYAGRRLDEVQRGLDLRARVGEFAIEAQGLEPAALQKLFLERFSGTSA